VHVVGPCPPGSTSAGNLTCTQQKQTTQGEATTTLMASNIATASLPDESTPLVLPDETIHKEEEATMSSAVFWKVGAIYGASAVALGAFGAHGLKKTTSDPQKLANWGTAAQYQVSHSRSRRPGRRTGRQADRQTTTNPNSSCTRVPSC
jgi:hypothetical protein